MLWSKVIAPWIFNPTDDEREAASRSNGGAVQVVLCCSCNRSVQPFCTADLYNRSVPTA
jgi:hypothetical protein